LGGQGRLGNQKDGYPWERETTKERNLRVGQRVEAYRGGGSRFLQKETGKKRKVIPGLEGGEKTTKKQKNKHHTPNTQQTNPTHKKVHPKKRFERGVFSKPGVPKIRKRCPPNMGKGRPRTSKPPGRAQQNKKNQGL